MHFKRLKYSFLLILMIIAFSSCDRNRNHPGWDYFPDMFYSAAYETYTPNPNFEDGKTMRTPPEGTVPRGFLPFEYTIDEEERIRAGKELKNPFIPDENILEKGKENYHIFCANCHGDKGDGSGYLYESGLYLVNPRTLVGETAQELKPGEIYHSITVGFGSMGPHGSLIRPDDRWGIITYIREVLQPQAAEK